MHQRSLDNIWSMTSTWSEEAQWQQKDAKRPWNDYKDTQTNRKIIMLTKSLHKTIQTRFTGEGRCPLWGPVVVRRGPVGGRRSVRFYRPSSELCLLGGSSEFRGRKRETSPEETAAAPPSTAHDGRCTGDILCPCSAPGSSSVPVMVKRTNTGCCASYDR